MKSVNNSRLKYLIGIDEVGRGPIAGPVTLGAAIVSLRNKKEILKKFRSIKESKQLKAAQREEWFAKMKEAKVEMNRDRAAKKKIFGFAVSSVSSAEIDKKGLAPAIRKALAASLEKLQKEFNFEPGECLVLLDGGLKAPAEYVHQKTIIKGDEKEPIIAFASIAAKVTRDAYMCKMAKLKAYAVYDFDIHKGYGTARHYKKIKKAGLSPLHRRSFLKNFI